MKYFNKYQLNANFTTEDGIDLINPTFEIVEIYIFAENLTFDVVLHWIDEKNNIKRSFKACHRWVSKSSCNGDESVLESTYWSKFG